MSRRKQIDQGSTKYPRESAPPTATEEEGLQAAGEGGGGGGLGPEGKIAGSPSTGAGHGGSPHRHANPG